jgi:hypothetical protein
MSTGRGLRYQWNVNLLGRSGLRARRWLDERGLLGGPAWSTDHLAPPLRCTPRMKELVARHWLEGRYANLQHKVAWVTSGAPVELLKADDARKIYQDIVRQKKDPDLLEYVGYGLYKTSVFPMPPGKERKILIHYTTVCRKDRDLVEVWYPLNTEKFSAKAIEEVKVKVDIKAGADILAVYSPSHDLDVRKDKDDPRHVEAVYQAKNTLPIADFQVFYKAADEKIGATLLTHQPDLRKDGYLQQRSFGLVISPYAAWTLTSYFATKNTHYVHCRA